MSGKFDLLGLCPRLTIATVNVGGFKKFVTNLEGILKLLLLSNPRHPSEQSESGFANFSYLFVASTRDEFRP